MKYTNETIERTKNDPLVKLLCMLAGANVDDIIKEIESKDDSYETPNCNKKDISTQELKSDLKAIESKKKEFPISKENYDFIVKCALEFNRSINDMVFAGFTVDTKNLNLVGSPLAMIYCLLRILCGDYFAGKFMAGLSNGKESIGKEYFDILYDDQTRFY